MKIIAHRGAHRNKNEENSLLAFSQAVIGGYKMMELDVRLTKDEELVVSHDAYIEFENRSLAIKNFTLKELVEMGIVTESISGSIGNFYPRPTLLLILEIFSRFIQINVEFKDRGSAAAFLNLWPRLEKQVRVFTVHSCLEKINISSRHLKELVKIRQHFLDMEIGITMGRFQLFWKKRKKIWDKLKKLCVTYVDIHLSSANKETIAFLQEKGFKVRVYTVNDSESLLNCYQFGVDGIFTDSLGTD